MLFPVFSHFQFDGLQMNRYIVVAIATYRGISRTKERLTFRKASRLVLRCLSWTFNAEFALTRRCRGFLPTRGGKTNSNRPIQTSCAASKENARLSESNKKGLEYSIHVGWRCVLRRKTRLNREKSRHRGRPIRRSVWKARATEHLTFIGIAGDVRREENVAPCRCCIIHDTTRPIRSRRGKVDTHSAVYVQYSVVAEHPDV